MTQTTQSKSRDRWQAGTGNVRISDGEESSFATWSPSASNETIVRDYLRGYGYCDPDVIMGRWSEGRIYRDGNEFGTTFYWRLTGAARGNSGSGGYAYDLRFSQPPSGDTRVDGYRYSGSRGTYGWHDAPVQGVRSS